MSTLAIRKSVAALTLADLTNSPAWEFAIDEEGVEGQDGTTVRPYPVAENLDPSAGMFVVRANFNLADGSPMPGYLTPPVQGEIGVGTYQPVVITPTGQVGFWCGIIVPDAAAIAENYRRLGKTSSSKVFPLRFESEVPLKSGTVSGEIAGF